MRAFRKADTAEAGAVRRPRTRLLMGASALFMAVCGTGALFLPQELLGHLGTTATPALTVLTQAAGALYLGFAALNWMARGLLIGGIYGRPLVIGNLLHFVVVAITVLKTGFRLASPLMIGWAVAYCVLAIAFCLVLFTDPLGRPGGTDSRGSPSLTD